MNKSVLFLSSCVNGGGAGRSLVTILENRPQDIECHVVVPEKGVIGHQLERHAKLWVMPEFLERIQKTPYAWIQRISSAAVRNTLGGFVLGMAIVKISLLIRRIRPNLIYCNHMLAEPIGVFLGWLHGIKVVIHARNVHLTKAGEQFYDFLAERSCVHRVLSNSQYTSSQYQRSVPDKVRVIYNGINLDEFDRSRIQPALRGPKGFSDRDYLFGFVGRIVPWKGLHLLVEAFAQVHKAVQHAKLVVIGEVDPSAPSDYFPSLEQQVAQLNLHNHIVFAGFTQDVRAWVADLNAVVVPSISPEPFGRVLIEALALGVPLIVADQGGPLEIVENGKYGLLFESRNPQSLSQKMSELANTPRLSQQLIAAGLERVHRQFSSIAHGQRVWEEIKRVI